MNQNTKTIVSFLIVIILLGAGFYYFRGAKRVDNANEPAPMETSSLKHFESAGVAFDYNAFFVANGGDGTPSTDWREFAQNKGKGVVLGDVYIPNTYMPGTNFSEAYLIVGQSSELNEIKNCVVADATIREKDNGSYDIGGYPFNKFTSTGAAAGSFYETTSHRGIVDGGCYVVEYTIHSTNVSNYPPDQGIKEFDKSKIQNEMEKIISSIRFLVNSK